MLVINDPRSPRRPGQRRRLAAKRSCMAALRAVSTNSVASKRCCLSAIFRVKFDIVHHRRWQRATTCSCKTQQQLSFSSSNRKFECPQGQSLCTQLSGQAKRLAGGHPPLLGLGNLLATFVLETRIFSTSACGPSPGFSQSVQQETVTTNPSFNSSQPGTSTGRSSASLQEGQLSLSNAGVSGSSTTSARVAEALYLWRRSFRSGSPHSACDFQQIAHFQEGDGGSVWKAGYAVIYLFRSGTVQPFTNGTHSDRALQWLFEQATLDNSSPPKLSAEAALRVETSIDQFACALREGTLLRLPFTTLFEYLTVKHHPAAHNAALHCHHASGWLKDVLHENIWEKKLCLMSVHCHDWG